MTLGGFYSPPGSLAGVRNQFIANVLAITGDTRIFWLPAGTDTTTSTDLSLTGRTITHSVSLASRLSALGLGYAVSFDASNDFATIADADDLSFNDGSSQGFSIVSVANITNTAAARTLLSKYDSVGVKREWELQVSTTDTLRQLLYDESGDFDPISASDAAITMGSWVSHAVTYNGGGGATAAAGIVMYEDGAAIANTAAENASYVAMENLATEVGIGARSSSDTNKFSGSMALMLLSAKTLTASEVHLLHQYFVGYFGI